MTDIKRKRYVALLYSISLPDARRLVMKDLKDMAWLIGLEDPQTLLSTGNLLFNARDTDAASLEAKLEIAYAERFGRHVDFLIREATDWPNIVAANPFFQIAERTPRQVMLRVMRIPISSAAVAALSTTAKDGEKVAAHNGDLWIQFEGAPERSRLLPRLSRQKLGIGTLRNWATVRAIGNALASNGGTDAA